MPLQDQSHILIIGFDDLPTLYERVLNRAELTVKRIKYEEFDLNEVGDFSPNLILIDTPSSIIPPVFDILNLLRSNQTTVDIPIILSLMRADVSKVRALNLDDDDFIYKPFDPRELVARVKVKLKIRSLETQLGYRKGVRIIKPGIEHVFISYSRTDSEYANRLADKLTYSGFVPWIDKRQLGSGDEWWENILRALRECAAFVVIMTPEARNSTWVRKEVMLAHKWKKPAFPLLLKGENWEIYIDTHYDDVRDGMLPSSVFWEHLAKVALIYG